MNIAKGTFLHCLHLQMEGTGSNANYEVTGQILRPQLQCLTSLFLALNIRTMPSPAANSLYSLKTSVYVCFRLTHYLVGSQLRETMLFTKVNLVCTFQSPSKFFNIVRLKYFARNKAIMNI